MRLVPLGQEHTDAFDQLGRHLVAPAFVPEHLLEAALELGMPVTGGALPQVALDLHALQAHELPVQVELDLLECVLAFNR
jgi:hypothetical protein